MTTTQKVGRGTPEISSLVWIFYCFWTIDILFFFAYGGVAGDKVRHFLWISKMDDP